jgi:ABC-type multidrug transport system ATPase subunit
MMFSRTALGWTLSGGQQQMLAIARGLMARPKLLLLDEPSLGLAPIIMQQVYRVIADIRRQGTTVLLVEQNANMALSVADRGYVLETGRLVTFLERLDLGEDAEHLLSVGLELGTLRALAIRPAGQPEALWNNEDVRTAYLGGECELNPKVHDTFMTNRTEKGRLRARPAEARRAGIFLVQGDNDGEFAVVDVVSISFVVGSRNDGRD